MLAWRGGGTVIGGTRRCTRGIYRFTAAAEAGRAPTEVAGLGRFPSTYLRGRTRTGLEPAAPGGPRRHREAQLGGTGVGGIALCNARTAESSSQGPDGSRVLQHRSQTMMYQDLAILRIGRYCRAVDVTGTGGAASHNAQWPLRAQNAPNARWWTRGRFHECRATGKRRGCSRSDEVQLSWKRTSARMRAVSAVVSAQMRSLDRSPGRA